MLDEEKDSVIGVSGADVLDPKMLAEMERFVKLNFKRDKIEPYPQEWMGDTERAAFSCVAESLLGEQRSDHWLQNKVFKDFGSDYFDFDKPLTAEEGQIDVVDDTLPSFGPLPTEFLRNFGGFLDRLVRELSKMPEYSSDVDRVPEGMMAGVAYALNAPKPGNMDQRLNFFVLFPSNLSFDTICDYLDVSKARVLALRIRNTIDKSNFTFKKDEDFTEQDISANLKSIDACRSKNPHLKSELIAVFNQIAEDSSEGSEDGLLSYLTQIIKSGRSTDLEKFIGFHVSKRTLSARSKEGKRKEHEVSIYCDGEDGNEQTFDAEISVTEDVTEGNVYRVSAANRHSFQRTETHEEKSQLARKAKEYTAASLEATSRFVEMIIQELRDEAIRNFEEKDKAKEEINDSDCLGLLLPEALYYYVQAAIEQVNSVINAENVTTTDKAGWRLAYKKGRSQVGFKDNGQRDLASLVDLDCLEQQLAPYRERKRLICFLHNEGKPSNLIAKEIGCEISFVEDTICQIKMIGRSKTQREKYVWDLHERGKSPVEIVNLTDYSSSFVNAAIAKRAKLLTNKKTGEINDEKKIGRTLLGYFDDLTAANIKNSFSWRWGRILTVLYEPLKDDPFNKDVEKQVQAWALSRKKKDDSTMEPKDYPMFYRRKLRRRYHLFDAAVLADLVSLLTVHSFIEQGTIPAKTYPLEERQYLMTIDNLNKRFKAIKNKKITQPGAAWGHNSCRATGESNIYMFYQVFYGGLDRKKHKDIRDRIAFIIRVRNAKGQKNGRQFAAADDEYPVD